MAADSRPDILVFMSDQHHAGYTGKQGSRRNAGPGLEGGTLCGRHRDTSPAVVAAQWRKRARFSARRIDVLLDSRPHACQVLPQPVVTETDAGVRVCLGLSCSKNRLEGFDLMSQTREGFAFCIDIRKGGSYSEGCSYDPCDKRLSDAHRSLSGVAHGVHAAVSETEAIGKTTSNGCVV